MRRTSTRDTTPRNRTVLEYRVEGKVKEPWTWVRTQGKGRVFYTAWGHDQRTWGNPGFHDLVERGIRWATARAPAEALQPVVAEKPFPFPSDDAAQDVKPFEYVDVGKKIPNYKAKKGGKGEHAQPDAVTPPAEESEKHSSCRRVSPRGVRVRPLIRRPICMNWDERGRLWIAESWTTQRFAARRQGPATHRHP